jgi:hypothetical protein
VGEEQDKISIKKKLQDFLSTCRSVSFVILLVFLIFLSPIKTFCSDIFQKNDEGHFEKLHSDFLIVGNPIKLKDGRVLITGGEKDIEKRLSGEPVKIMNEAEIFDPKTGKSKLINNMNYEKVEHKSILLDDGRILFYGGNRNELYIPKVYKKIEAEG